ncbi:MULTISPECIES: BsuPI-related putative proteinase inhibitor [Bacillus]|uniref:BsuPI-related putative proteinase inhibitor n=1 Tax=Bacillus TaxID=1386 RepID=UPI000BB88FA7|nr:MULTISPECIES: BsuPI-related putative proteinase inhibitor [Bacillus]
MKKWAFLSIIFLLILSACGTGSTSPTEQPPTTGSGEEKRKEVEDPREVSEELQSTAEFKGETFIFTITNETGGDVDIVFSSGQEIDYIVFDSNGAKVKQLSDDMMYTQAIRETLLAEGDSLTYEVPMEEVTDDLPNGSYTITFIFTADKHTEATTDFNIAID